MTRTLPWITGPSTGTPQANRSIRNTLPRAKRRKVIEPSSDLDDDNGGDRRGGGVMHGPASPSADFGPPTERAMDEGLDKDDRFRMVEDEFLDIAKQFTQHLHAAEYQRLKKAARSQNELLINSISRPVSDRMPDETRRKVESVARAKKQAAAVRSLIRKKGLEPASDDDSDVKGDPWLGTTLHGLMESPRKTTASLSKIGTQTISTRAAIGFDNSRLLKPFNNLQLPALDLESFETGDEDIKPPEKAFSDPSSGDGDEDDLDAPIRSRSATVPDRSTSFKLKPYSGAMKQEREKAPSGSHLSNSFAGSSRIAEDDIDNISLRISDGGRERIAKRLEQARLRRVKEDQDARKKLEIIPMFLS